MATESTFDILIATLDRVVYEGKGSSLILPGENGVFEILPYHKKLLSRLKAGPVVLDGTTYPIKKGVVRVSPTDVTVIVEEAR